ncbi:DNA-binding protein [Nonomuraea turcica]|uniref:DNA-binding protein n=1 Tax=Nonomuraea sp. G32 TaxID=3067274 RepID=UPI00273BA6AD|nr:DNA-binding protein [Nonomuraea sp. G32]MDP4511176.1 DNA-binding protein [Nonomuraea sp. G32]
MAQALTIEELLALPATVDLPTAGRAFGIGRTKAHELARSGTFPCHVLRIGSTYRVGRAAILRALDIDDPAFTLTTPTQVIDIAS